MLCDLYALMSIRTSRPPKRERAGSAIIFMLARVIRESNDRLSMMKSAKKLAQEVRRLTAENFVQGSKICAVQGDSLMAAAKQDRDIRQECVGSGHSRISVRLRNLMRASADHPEGTIPLKSGIRQIYGRQNQSDRNHCQQREEHA